MAHLVRPHQSLHTVHDIARGIAGGFIEVEQTKHGQIVEWGRREVSFRRSDAVFRQNAIRQWATDLRDFARPHGYSDDSPKSSQPENFYTPGNRLADITEGGDHAHRWMRRF